MSTNLLTSVGIKVITLYTILLNALSFAGAQDDTLRQNVSDTLIIASDTIVSDTVSVDTTRFGVSPNAIKSRVDYKAVDSIRFDMKTQKVYMFN